MFGLKLLSVALAGAIGAMCRYALVTYVHRDPSLGFPWGTLVVNLVGCLLIGIVMGVFDGRVHFAAPARALVFAGFLGSFTTFSTFALETQNLLDSQPHMAFLNIFLHVGVGLMLVYGGLMLGRNL